MCSPLTPQFNMTPKSKPLKPTLSPVLSAQCICHIQDIVGSLSWYGCTYGPTMLATLSSIAGRQAKCNKKLEEEIKQFFNYCDAHPETGVCFFLAIYCLTCTPMHHTCLRPTGKNDQHDITFSHDSTTSTSSMKWYRY